MTLEEYLRRNFVDKHLKDYVGLAMVAGDPNGPVLFYLFPKDSSPDDADGTAVAYNVNGNTVTLNEGK